MIDTNDELLKTIKYNPRDLKGLKNILPKANYEEEGEKLKLEDMRGGINSCKNSRKQSAEVQSTVEPVNDQKLREFLERRKMIEEKEREKQLKQLKDERSEIARKRERVLSACGVRQPYIGTHTHNSSIIPKNSSAQPEGHLLLETAQENRLEEQPATQGPKTTNPHTQQQQQPDKLQTTAQPESN